MTYIVVIKTNDELGANALVSAMRRNFDLGAVSKKLQFNDWEHVFIVNDMPTCVSIQEYVRKHFRDHIIDITTRATEYES